MPIGDGAEGSGGTAGWARPAGGWPGHKLRQTQQLVESSGFVLNAAARKLIEKVSPENATAVLEDLLGRGGEAGDPSEFVSKALCSQILSRVKGPDRGAGGLSKAVSKVVARPRSVIPKAPPVGSGEAHKQQHRLYKTQLCKRFEGTGSCQLGEACQFAHGQAELRGGAGGQAAPAEGAGGTGAVATSPDEPGAYVDIPGAYIDVEEDLADVASPNADCDDGPNRPPPGDLEEPGDASAGVRPAKRRRALGKYADDEDEAALGPGGGGARASSWAPAKRAKAAAALCKGWVQTGDCQFGERCKFAHGEEELMAGPAVKKAELCKYVSQGKTCMFGSVCWYAHTEEELQRATEAAAAGRAPLAQEYVPAACPERNLYYKTRPCFAFNARGRCKLGDRCQYAHGDHELRQARQDEGVEQKASGAAAADKYKTQMCAEFRAAGTCGSGASCRYAHSEDELRPAPRHGGGVEDCIHQLLNELTEQGTGLDDDALHKVYSVQPVKVLPVLEEVYQKSTILRNCSSYFIRVMCNTLKREQAAAKEEQAAAQAPAQLPNRGSNPARQAKRLMQQLMAKGVQFDEEAIEALDQLPLSEGVRLLEDLIDRGDSIKNPSAFVTRAARNFTPTFTSQRREQAEASAARRHAAAEEHRVQLMQQIEARGVCFDEDAVEALSMLSIEDVLTILEDVLDREHLKNPSAYVTRAAHNIVPKSMRTDSSASREAYAFEEQRKQLIRKIESRGVHFDEDAVEALNLLSIQDVLRVLQDVVDKEYLKNPSAYVTRAAHNIIPVSMRPSASGSRTSSALVEHRVQLTQQIEARGVYFDEDAVEALNLLSTEDAVSVLQDVVDKEYLKNPSAYVTRAAHNIIPPSMRTDGSGFKKSAAAEERWKALMHQLEEGGVQFDDDAMRALSQLPLEDGANLLQDVIDKGNLWNPSAYIMRAVVNVMEACKVKRIPLMQQLEARGVQLDPDAREALRRLPLVEAVKLLEYVVGRHDLWNPSAWIRRACHNIIPASALNRTDDLVPPAPPPPAPRVTVRAEDRLAEQRQKHLLQQLAANGVHFDDQSIVALKEMPCLEGVKLLEEIVAKGRLSNPSAYLTRAAHNFMIGLREAKAAAAEEQSGQPTKLLVPRWMQPQGGAEDGGIEDAKGGEEDRPIERSEGMPDDEEDLLVSDALPPEETLARERQKELLQELAAQNMCFDQTSMAALKQMPCSEGVKLLEEAVGKDRLSNPSAWLTKAARNFMIAFRQTKAAGAQEGGGGADAFPKGAAPSFLSKAQSPAPLEPKSAPWPKPPPKAAPEPPPQPPAPAPPRPPAAAAPLLVPKAAQAGPPQRAPLVPRARAALQAKQPEATPPAEPARAASRRPPPPPPPPPRRAVGAPETSSEVAGLAVPGLAAPLAAATAPMATTHAAPAPPALAPLAPAMALPAPAMALPPQTAPGAAPAGPWWSSPAVGLQQPGLPEVPHQLENAGIPAGLLMHPGMSTAHAPAPGVAPSAAPALVVPPWRTDPLPGTLPPTMALEGLATQASTGAAPLLIPVSTHPAAQAAPAPVLQAFPLQSHTAPAPAVQTAPVPALYTAPSPALQMVTPQAPPRQAAVPPAAPAPPAPPVVVPHAQATAAAPQAPMLVPTELPVPQPAARRPSLRRGEAEQLQTVLDCLTGPRAAAAPAAQAGAPAVASGQARAVAPAAAAPVPPTAVKEESSQASASQAPVMLPDGWSAKYSGRKQQYYYFRVDQSGRPYERGHDNKTKTYWLHEFQAALAESGPGWPLEISEPPPAAPASSSAARPADVPVLTLEQQEQQLHLAAGRRVLSSGVAQSLDMLGATAKRAAAGRDRTGTAIMAAALAAVVKKLDKQLRSAVATCHELRAEKQALRGVKRKADSLEENAPV